jgi:hypothetical protein
MTREQAIDLILRTGGHRPPNSDEHRELLKFLDASPECRKLYEDQRATWQALDLWETVEPSLGFDRCLRERVEELSASRTWFAGWLTPWRPNFAVGLAGLLLVAATVFHQPSLSGPGAKVAAVSGEDQAYLEEFNRALDDIEMLSEFEIDPAALAAPGPS